MESEATVDWLNNVGMNNIDIPVYALATRFDVADFVGDQIVERAPDWWKLWGILVKYIPHIAGDDWSQIGDYSDGVVSVESQQGGCEASHVIGGQIFHIGSPHNNEVIAYLQNLLSKKANDSSFSKNWFKPTSRTFDHYLWAADMVVDVVSDITDMPDEYSEQMHSYIELLQLINNTQRLPAKYGINHINKNIRLLNIHFDEIEGFDTPTIIVTFDNDDIFVFDSLEVECPVPDTFFGDVDVTLMLKDRRNKIYIKHEGFHIDSPVVNPVTLSAEEIFTEKGASDALRLRCFWDDGSVTNVTASDIVFENSSIAKFQDGEVFGLKRGLTNATIYFAGLTCTTLVHVYDSDADGTIQGEEDTSNSVCATVKLSFNQSMVMTREAFRGTLTVNNGNKNVTMKDVKLNLQVKDDAGTLATMHEFQIQVETLNGFTGEIDLNAGWSLGPDSTGVATILFIPTKFAAPIESKDWSFGGTFSYIDPTTNLVVTRELTPVILSVSPSPSLKIDYFMQRDVLGDDALTEDVVEPSIPAEFSVIIKNTGYGDAKNVRLVTEQPEMLDNEKGLLINYEILSSQLNGGDKTLALGQKVATEFGTIPANKSSYAQWWFTSSKLGHFTEYNVQATHITSYDNPDLSLLEDVDIHELIHTLNLPTTDNVPLRGFLVNDDMDSYDQPDKLYLTNGTTIPVHSATATMIKNGDNLYSLTITSNVAGWNYGSIVDPTAGRKVLIAITRQSDNAIVDVSNFWQTDRTLPDGKDPIYEFRFHFADELSSNSETYTLLFEDKPSNILAVDSIVAQESNIQQLVTKPMERVRVYFNKPIKASSFTTDALMLTCEAQPLDVTAIEITKIADDIFELNLHELTLSNGYYVLTVQTTSLKDMDGYAGETGKSISWHQLKDGLVNLVITVVPDEAGNVVAVSQAVYGSVITMTATASEGYDFSNWIVNGDVVSFATSYSIQVVRDLNVIAHFQPKNYNVTINVDTHIGSITGAETGIYQFGDTLILTATPIDGYMFDHWTINGRDVYSGDGKLVLPVNMSIDVKAHFVKSSINGDVNCDGAVDIGDIVTAIRVMSGSEARTNIVAASDVNADGATDIGDIVTIINIMTSQTVSVRRYSALHAPRQFSDDSIEAFLSGNYLSISLRNGREYSAFQLTLTLPEGTTLDGATMNCIRGSKHSLAVRPLGDGRCLVIGYSMEGQPLFGYEGQLFSISTTGTQPLSAVISGVVMADGHGTTYHLAGCEAVQGTVTDIKGMSNDYMTNDKCYDLLGRPVTNVKLRKGVYVINGNKIVIK